MGAAARDAVASPTRVGSYNKTRVRRERGGRRGGGGGERERAREREGGGEKHARERWICNVFGLNRDACTHLDSLDIQQKVR